MKDDEFMLKNYECNFAQLRIPFLSRGEANPIFSEELCKNEWNERLITLPRELFCEHPRNAIVCLHSVLVEKITFFSRDKSEILEADVTHTKAYSFN